MRVVKHDTAVTCAWCEAGTSMTFQTSKGDYETFYTKYNFQKAEGLVDDKKARVRMFLRIDID